MDACQESPGRRIWMHAACSIGRKRLRTSIVETTGSVAPADIDLVTVVQRLLQQQPEPLTLSKIRASLPAPFKNVSPEELVEVLRRQVAANVLYQYPKYRSQQDRFWDRPMAVHVAGLLRAALQ